MKASFTFAAIFAGALLIANAASAQSYSLVETETFTAKLTQLPGSSRVRVLITKPAGKKLWVTVRDAQHYPISFMKVYEKETEHLFLVDMKEMPDGKYTFELESDQKASNGKRPFVSKTVIKEKAILAQPIEAGERFVFSN